MTTNFCTNCGLCCMHMRTPPFIGPTDPEFKALPPELKKELNEWLSTGQQSPRFSYLERNHSDNVPCAWLNVASGQCLHYEHRPQICRDYEVGSQSCRTVRKEYNLTVKGMPCRA